MIMEYTVEPNTERKSKRSFNRSTFLSLIGDDDESSSSSSATNYSDQKFSHGKQMDKPKFPFNSTPSDLKRAPGPKLGLSPISMLTPVKDKSPTKKTTGVLKNTANLIDNEEKTRKESPAPKRGILTKRTNKRLSIAPTQGIVPPTKQLFTHQNDDISEAETIPENISPKKKQEEDKRKDIGDLNLDKRKGRKHGEGVTDNIETVDTDSGVFEKETVQKQPSRLPKLLRNSSKPTHQEEVTDSEKGETDSEKGETDSDKQKDLNKQETDSDKQKTGSDKQKTDSDKQEKLQNESPRKRQANEQIQSSPTRKHPATRSHTTNSEEISPPIEPTQSPRKRQKVIPDVANSSTINTPTKLRKSTTNTIEQQAQEKSPIKHDKQGKPQHESPRKRPVNEQIQTSPTRKQPATRSRTTNSDEISQPNAANSLTKNIPTKLRKTTTTTVEQQAQEKSPKKRGRPKQNKDSDNSVKEASRDKGLLRNEKGNKSTTGPSTTGPNSSRKKNRKSVPLHRRQRALQEIRKFQKSTEMLIPKLPFSRVVREVALGFNMQPLRFTGLALLALQEGAESFLVNFLEQSYLLALHAKRVTLMPKDLKLLRVLRDF